MGQKIAIERKAHSLLTIKASSESNGRRTFTGIATTPTPDSYGDVVEPKGAEFKLPIPLLWMHDSSDPIGWITRAKVTDEGIEVEGEVATVTEEGELGARLTKAWQMLKAGLVQGLSIGFRGLEAAEIKGTWGYRFTKWLWLELSAVTIPANQDATIVAIKSASVQAWAASGRKGIAPGTTKPGVSGSQPPTTKGTAMDIREQLAQMREDRRTKATRLDEIKTAAAGRKMNDEERDEFDGLLESIEELDDAIRLKSADVIDAGTAREVKGQSSQQASASRKGAPMLNLKHTDKEDAFEGQSFVRKAIAQALSFIALKQGRIITPDVFAQKRWGQTNPRLVEVVKAAVAGGGTGSGEWGAELAQSDTKYTGDFVDYLWSMTIFDRLPLRPVPERIHIKGSDGVATGYWVGESKAIPVSKGDASDVELTPLKVGAIAVCSKELIESSDPSAELWIRDMLVKASAQRVDQTFLSATAAAAGVSPAGILNGLTPIAPSGTDADAVRADLMSLYAPHLAAKNASGLVQIMTPSMAKALQLLRNSLGQREFPDIRADGGTLEGDQVFTGDNVTPGDWILLKPSEIWKIGERAVEVSMSDTATIEQDDAPQGAGDTPTAASATLMSLWQTENVGFKVVRPINFKLRRPSAVTYLANAEYGGVVS